jgi:predicted nucleic acid-binding protein
MIVLLDTGFSVLDSDDELHKQCADALLLEFKPVLPDVVLPELAYMILRELGYSVLVSFINSIINGELTMGKMTQQDLVRISEILKKYSDSHVDFVDCAIVAMSERLNIRRIMTVDKRHFNLFRPSHCPYFTLIP